MQCIGTLTSSWMVEHGNFKHAVDGIGLLGRGRHWLSAQRIRYVIDQLLTPWQGWVEEKKLRCLLSTCTIPTTLLEKSDVPYNLKILQCCSCVIVNLSWVLNHIISPENNHVSKIRLIHIQDSEFAAHAWPHHFSFFLPSLLQPFPHHSVISHLLQNISTEWSPSQLALYCCTGCSMMPTLIPLRQKMKLIVWHLYPVLHMRAFMLWR